MRGQVGLLCVLVGTLVFSGCTDDPTPQAPPPAGTVVTDPLDYSYLETDGDNGSHIHDYWRGQETLQIVGDASRGSSWECDGCADGAAVMRARPESGSVVPQGARWINVTFTWSDREAGAYSGAELWIKTAADGETKRIGPIENGVPLTYETNNDQNDPPHHVLSLWVFELRIVNDGEIRFYGDIEVQALATRGLEIPPWPAHPDHWGGEDRLDVVDRDARVVMFARYSVGTGTTSTCFFECSFYHALDDGAIVPPRTGHVEVVLTFAPGAIPAGVALTYHGADSWDYTVLEPTATTPLEWTYRIDITPGRHDSPYAQQSLWEFYIELDQDGPAAAWQGDFHLKVTAVKATS